MLLQEALTAAFYVHMKGQYMLNSKAYFIEYGGLHDGIQTTEAVA